MKLSDGCQVRTTVCASVPLALALRPLELPSLRSLVPLRPGHTACADVKVPLSLLSVEGAASPVRLVPATTL